MIYVKVVVIGKNMIVGSMMKAAAAEIAGTDAVRGVTGRFLREFGCCVFHFREKAHAEAFYRVLRKYLHDAYAAVSISEDSN
jgi:hypothetical protein